MDNITLNGFEVFEELMPGASVKNKPIVSPTNEEEEETKIDLEGIGEELSEEELNNIRKNTKTETEEEEEEEEEEEAEEAAAAGLGALFGQIFSIFFFSFLLTTIFIN